jgi:hypothetical protein
MKQSPTAANHNWHPRHGRGIRRMMGRQMSHGSVSLRGNRVVHTLGLAAVGLLFLPKINLIEFEGFRAGLRLDDFVIAVVAGALLVLGCGRAIMREKVFVWALGFVAASFASNVMGGSMLFSLRMLEYISVFVIGMALAQFGQHDSLAKVLFAYVLINTAIGVLQSAGIVGGIGIKGFVHEFDRRVFGLCNGPWELGIVVCLIVSYLTDSGWLSAKAWRRLALYGCAGVLLILTAARTPLAIFTVICLFEITRPFPPGVRMIARIAVPLVAVIGLYVLVWSINTENFAVVRLREFLNPSNLKELITFVQQFKPNPTQMEIPAGAIEIYSQANMDASMAIRFDIFSFLLSNYYFGGPIVWVLGLGHGFGGPSTDMGIVRIFCEIGVIGFVCFHMMLLRSAMMSYGIRLMVMCVVLNQLTLDVYVGYKTMFVFFIIVGFESVWGRRRLSASEGRVMPARTVLATP